MNHDEAVTKHYVYASNTLEDGYWDDVFFEESYFEETEKPFETPEGETGLEVGEFDVLHVNYEDELALYKEIKTSRGDLSYAEEQIERAEEFFEGMDWDVIGRTVLEK